MIAEDPRQLVHGLVDEDERNERGEDILDELGEVLDQSGALDGGNDEGDDEGPDADPGPPVEKLAGKVGLTELEQSVVEEQHRSRGADDDQWTSREERVENAGGATDDQGLGDTDGVISFFCHQTTEGNAPGQAGEVDEDDGGETLWVEAVLEVAQILGVPLLHVVNHSSKRNFSPVHGISFRGFSV